MLKSAREFYVADQERKALALAAVRAEWRRLPSPAAWNASTLNRIVALLTAAQIGSAQDSAAYVPEALAEQGIVRDQVAQVNPAGYAGIAYGFQPGDAFDGLPLDTLVNTAPGLAGARGLTVTEKMVAGQSFLDMLTHWQISEAGSAAASSSISAWRTRMGWVRMVNPPCCKDCAVQAGKWFAHNQGFKRHPHCDCYHVPSPRDADLNELAPTPSLDQVTGLNQAERKAIGDGADFNQVVNSARGRAPGGNLTLEGTTKSGWFSYAQRAANAQRGARTATEVVRASRGTRQVTRTRVRRLTPKAIYRVSATREEAVRRLIENGYMVGDLESLGRLVN